MSLPTTKVNSWITSPDQTTLHAKQPSNSLQRGQIKSSHSLIIDPAITHQTMLGFGAAVTDAATSVIWSMKPDARDALMRELFDPAMGLGMSVVRLPMGASDFARFSYTYDDNRGKPDPNLNHFSIAVDLEHTVPLLKAALALNPKLQIIASPWSPPAWMKQRRLLGLRRASVNGGRLRSRYYAEYAQYFVKFIQAYSALGLPIYAVTIQNEPGHATDNYPSMKWSAAEQARFIGAYLGPALASAGITTKILAYDHNWDDTATPLALLRDVRARPYISGIAWHAYAGTVDNQSEVHESYPEVEHYLTEITASQPGNFGADLGWHMRNIVLGAPNNWARATMHWNLALNEHNGPLNGGYTSGQGIVQIDSRDGHVTRYAPYYAIAHLSAHVQPGAYRIDCRVTGEGIIASAYRNLDNSYVCVVFNGAPYEHTITVQVGADSFQAQLGSGFVATYVWSLK